MTCWRKVEVGGTVRCGQQWLPGTSKYLFAQCCYLLLIADIVARLGFHVVHLHHVVASTAAGAGIGLDHIKFDFAFLAAW